VKGQTPLAKLEFMSLRTDTFDLGGLHLSAGEGRRFDLNVAIDPITLGGERYLVAPDPVPAQLEVSRMAGGGYALRLRLRANLDGPCMRCLEQAAPEFAVDVREVSLREGEEPVDELTSPYVEHELLDLRAWARDALALQLPASILCRPECAGLCAVCGENLNTAPPDHHHEREPDPRWAKLSELRFD
jgi:uncharacterized protein